MIVPRLSLHQPTLETAGYNSGNGEVSITEVPASGGVPEPGIHRRVGRPRCCGDRRLPLAADPVRLSNEQTSVWFQGLVTHH